MARTRLTALDHALLGIVDIEPVSGYDIHRLFSTSPMAAFSSSPGAIYPALDRLEKKGLLRATLDASTPTRPRRVYSMTEAGEAALEVWLREPVSRDELVRNPRVPVLRFSLAERRLSRSACVGYLEGFLRAVALHVEELRAYVASLPSGEQLHPRLAVEHGVESYECQARWAERAIEVLKGAPETPQDSGGVS